MGSYLNRVPPEMISDNHDRKVSMSSFFKQSLHKNTDIDADLVMAYGLTSLFNYPLVSHFLNLWELISCSGKDWINALKHRESWVSIILRRFINDGKTIIMYKLVELQASTNRVTGIVKIEMRWLYINHIWKKKKEYSMTVPIIWRYWANNGSNHSNDHWR